MVPTVLLVDKEGRVSEAKAPRDERSMTNVVRNAPAVPAEEVEAVANIPAAPTNASDPMPLVLKPRMATPYPVPGEDIEQLMESVSRQVSEQATARESAMRRTSESQGIRPIIPGTTSERNPLPFQSGGNPWAAFLMAARTAAPAAALLGAYAALPAKRSSGLGPATRRRRGSRRTRSSRRR